jgi:Fe-S oxidoreductase
LSASEDTGREGSLAAPLRHPLDWQGGEFWDADALSRELARVYDICHGCRRCVSLCNAFPTLFDLVDQSRTMEVDGVDERDYAKVVDQCYLCDLCFMTKCPYVPPHEWNVDFPHLMLRAKAVHYRTHGARARDRWLTSTQTVGTLAGIPVVAQAVNAFNRSAPARKLLDKALAIHPEAPLPRFHSDTARGRLARRVPRQEQAVPTAGTTGKLAIFLTCYGNRNRPDIVEDLVAVLEYNGIVTTTPRSERCCGMPKLELGDLDAVVRFKQHNVPELARLVDAGWDLTAPVPSCVLMFKQELPLMFPQDPDVLKVRDAFFDPFEYLSARRKAGRLNTDFKQSLGKIVWHVPCHQRVQNIGPKTREILELVPATEVVTVERCSGHDGTYAVKRENYEFARKICRPLVNRVREAQAAHVVSDCPMAGAQIGKGLDGGAEPESPFALLRRAYGL